MHLLIFLGICLSSFVIGSMPAGYLIGKLKGVDIRSKGSGNIGASNAFRVLGKKEGIFTLLFDMLKGLLVVSIVWFLFKNQTFTIVSAIFAVLGHDFSIFLNFKGGKGVATTYGVSLLFSVYSVVGLILWLIILKSTKYASLASLLSFGITSLIVIFANTDKSVKMLFVTLFIVMIIRHYQNILRLIQGKEHKIANQKKDKND